MANWDYTVNIEMDEGTVNELSANGFSLYGFKAVAGEPSDNGRPLVWFVTTSYGTTTKVCWNEYYQAYTSTSQIVPNGQVTAENPYDIKLKQRLDVTSDAGTGEVFDDDNLPGRIGINNKRQREFACGISQKSSVMGTDTPICAFPLFGVNMDTFEPVEKVLLFFATQQVDTGTVLVQSAGPGMLIDISGVSQRDVSYHINRGWDNGGAAWGTQYPAESELQKILVKPHSVMV